MTYPYPQGPYGPQDPYNQGGYPQTGGFPAQGGYPQQGGGYPPPPPPKSNTALIVSIVAVVVLALGALGITGFVAPGFFLAGDEKSGDGGGGDGDNGTGPDALAQAIVNGLNAKDQNALGNLRCPDAEEDVGEVISQVQMIQSAKLSGPVQQQDDTHASANVTVTTQQGEVTAAGEMVKQAEKWCWSAVSMGGNLPGSPSTAPSAPSTLPSAPPVDPSGVPSGGTPGSASSLMSDFIAKVNSGDSTGATGLACSANSSSVSSSVDSAVAGSGSVSIKGTPTESSSSSLADVTGTLNGSQAQGLLGVNSADGGSTWCVDYFSFY